MTAHILIVDGVPAANQELLVANGGRYQGNNYAEALASQARHCIGGLKAFVLAAAEGQELPDGLALSDFDGIAWTGSPLNAYNDTPQVKRQIAFARQAFQSGVPCFGSCWGLQVMAVALGGKVHKNPHGHQLGLARAIQLTEAGRSHPMYDGKGPVFDALCIHGDVVCDAPAGSQVLARNAVCEVQALSIRDGERSFWGVQYHPEFDLGQVSAMMKRSAKRLVERGYARSEDDAHAIAGDLRTLYENPARKDLAWRYGVGNDVLDLDRHRREFANWLRVEVAARMAQKVLKERV